MPFFVAYPVVSFLRSSVSTEKRDEGASNNGDTMEVHSITSSARASN
jgi:hypothetical protein